MGEFPALSTVALNPNIGARVMRQWQASKYELDSLCQAEVPIPEPADGQILVKTSAVSLNYRDRLALLGEFGRHHVLPIIPGSDAVGTIVQVGAGVQRFRIGERVTSHFAPKWLYGKARTPEQSATLGVPLPGVLGEYILLDAEGAVLTPPYLSDAETATLPIAALTAWCALFERCDLQPGQTVLVQGTGGVSLFVLQFARAAGASVIITSSSDEKLARAKQLGANQTINYISQPKWGTAAKSLCGGFGVDHAIDIAGGESIRQSLEATKIGGNVVIVGLLKESTFTLDILPFILQQGSIHTLSVGSRDAFEKMNRALEVNRMRPVIDREYKFSEVPEAFARLDKGPFGKIIIRVEE